MAPIVMKMNWTQRLLAENLRAEKLRIEKLRAEELRFVPGHRFSYAAGLQIQMPL